MRDPPKTECGCLHGGVIEKSYRTHPSHPMQCTCTCTLVQVWMHIPSDPQSVQLRNATITDERKTFENFYMLTCAIYVTLVDKV